MSPPLVRVNNLTVHFPVKQGLIWQRQTGVVRAVDGLTFEIYAGETLVLVGESGCGKSTTGRAILQMERPTAGQVYFEEIELTALQGEALRQQRRRMQMIFQDPYASLNPRMTVGSLIGEPLAVHGLAQGKAKRDRVHHLLDLVGLSPQHAPRYPHEFSGGQRQRIAIARALAASPDFIVGDEPIAALDVSIQAQVVNLLQALQQQLGLTYLFIAHDLSVVRHLCDRIAVMYLGEIVELADRVSLYDSPLHPYTQSLLSAVPIPDPVLEAKRERIILSGDVPSPLNPPSGCRFHTRCPHVMPQCRHEAPIFKEAASGHWTACHLIDGI